MTDPTFSVTYQLPYEDKTELFFETLEEAKDFIRKSMPLYSMNFDDFCIYQNGQELSIYKVFIDE